ncbi:coiled-coil domain-containing protein 189-like [Actinia tenebrosa]|uniref:Coiled-coil domain-containing protein 189-like n=1 Tax=Actinia tenebrosa TaxID=6105 RepID=A0A6P8IZD2_ACTTE|nr:coiled-coil domain-containing protein 189-like [Actinia tenebrosa]
MPSVSKERRFKPRVLCWVDLTLENVDEILKSKSADETQSILADIFKIKDHKEELRSGILIDLYYYSIQFAKDNNFTKEQISAFFSIIKCIHEMAIDTPFGNVKPVFEYTKDLILCHSIKRPPFSIALFSTDQVKNITTYIVNTYFRHYKLYKYAFTPKVRLDLAIDYIGLPATPPPSEVGEEDEKMTEEKKEEEGEEAEVAAEPEIEETPAVKELKTMISTVLQEQVEQLKNSVDLQIKAKDEEISKKTGISLADSGTAPKSPKGKGKRGK